MSDINVTPLVDVMLVLLIIFMVTVPALKDAISVDLPKKDRGWEPPPIARTELKMRVDKFGQLTFDGRIYSDEEIRDKLPGVLKGYGNDKYQVLLNMNRQTPLQPVVRVMSVIQKAGLKTIRMNPDDSPE
jgi:biopolymer transport protein ExbD